MIIRSRISLILASIIPEQLKLLALESQKIAELDYGYTLASTDTIITAQNSV